MTPLEQLGLPVWIGLIAICIGVAWWKPQALPAAGVFIVHILLMQSVKYIYPTNLQLWFLAVYTTTSLVCFLFLDKFAGSILAIVGLVYGLSLMGIVADAPRKIIADVAIIIGLCIASFSGDPPRGYLGGDHIYGDRGDTLGMGDGPSVGVAKTDATNKG